MYIIGHFEFKEYLQAAERLADAVYEYQLFASRGYADIFPTRTSYDPDMGKMFKESLNVADYAIWLVESKQILIKDQQFWQRRLDALNFAIRSMSNEEQAVFRSLQMNLIEDRGETERVLVKMKNKLEALIDCTPELQERSLDDEDADYEDDELEEEQRQFA